MTQRPSKWNDELIAQLKELYLEQTLPTAEIAKQLGFTKNAIIGKIHRLNLSRVSNNKDSEDISSSDDQDFIYDFTTPFLSNNDKKEKGEYKLEEIEAGMCIWPYGDRESGFSFCGEKTFSDKPYCSEHYDAVYLMVKKASKNTENLYTTSDIEADEDIEEDIEDIEDNES